MSWTHIFGRRAHLEQWYHPSEPAMIAGHRGSGTKREILPRGSGNGSMIFVMCAQYTLDI